MNFIFKLKLSFYVHSISVQYLQNRHTESQCKCTDATDLSLCLKHGKKKGEGTTVSILCHILI